jgi:hypothetical protein
MDIVAYLPAVVAFVAALVAILGAPKWDASKRGWHRLTRAGRLTLLLAGFALLASLVLTWRSQVAAESQRASRERVGLVAHTELRLALQQLSGPFYEVFLREAGDVPPEFGIVPANILDAKSRKLLASLDLNAESPATPAEGRPLKWGVWFAESAKAADGEIGRVLQTYAAYLDPDVLAALSDLRTSEFFGIRLKGMDDFLKANSFRGDEPLLFMYADPNSDHPFGYEHFWNVMIELDARLAKDEARLRRWGKR